MLVNNILIVNHLKRPVFSLAYQKLFQVHMLWTRVEGRDSSTRYHWLAGR